MSLLESDLIYLFGVTGTNFDPLYFCAHENITFLGTPFQAINCKISGLSSGSGLNDCQLTIVNNPLLSLLLRQHKNLLGFQVYIWRVSKSSIANSNPLYQSPAQIFTVSQKTNESNEEITFKLKPKGFKNKIPGRILTGNCSWKRYRGAGCDYAGNTMFNINNFPTQNLAEDVCNLSLDACKLRGNQANFSGIPTIDDL
jgi:lambda family phage minor tail protein L